MDITPRNYQTRVNKLIDKSVERGVKRLLAIMSTGTGKTLTSVFKIVEYLKQNKKVLILVDQKILVGQWVESLQKIDSSIRIGIERAGKKAKLTDQVVIGTPQTLGRDGVKRIKRFPKNHFDVCYADEAHRSIASTWLNVLNYFGFGNKSFDNDNILVGLTATGWRESGESMGILYDDIVINYDLSFAISEGWLCDFELYNVSTNTDLSSYKNQGDIDSAVDNDERNEEALKAYQEICPDEQALIYTASVDHAYRLAELFTDAGINTEVIEANTPDDEREQILEDYKKKKVKCITNFNTMSTGTDLPETSALMFLRPIGSKLLITQCLGRGLRPSSSAFVDAFKTAEQRRKALANSAKPACKVIDLYDKVGNQNFAHVPSLFGLHNELTTDKPKKFYKEVVEPLEEASKEHGFDKAQVKNLDEIELIVKNRKSEIKSLKLDPKIKDFTNRKWVSVGESDYEIMYSDNNKVLMIEQDKSKGELIDKEEYKLLEYDSKDGITKNLQTFNSLSGAFKIADEYADKQGWNTQFKEKAPWHDKGVTEGQLDTMQKVFKYKTGYAKYRLLNERYQDTGVRKVVWKPTGETLTRGDASALLDNFFNN